MKNNVIENQEKSLIKRLLPHIIAVVCFLAITLLYFSPVLDGKVLVQSDVTQFEGGAKELVDYYNKEGKSSAWTGSMFSGMPSYQLGVWGGSPNFLDYLEMPLKAMGSHTMGPVFTAMLMAYLLFSLMGFRPVVSILGAVAYSLSSYNIIIIEAGHITKAWALAYLPLIIAGLMLLFKKKYLWSGLLLALGLALQVKNNHLQVTYYTAIMSAVIYLAFVVNAIKEKEYKGLLKAIGFSAVAVVLAVLCNIGNLWANYEMSKESTRGKSELTSPTSSEKQSSGLDKKYAFDWSYGKAETLSLLIPDIHGGASRGQLSETDAVFKQMRANNIPDPIRLVKEGQVPFVTYWGDQPFTSGPVYFGAIICFLFLLGMCIVQNKLKWVFFGITILFIFLSWGRNFELFNDWFFYHFPMYSKFRAVSTALVIPAITMLIVAVWGLNEFFSKKVDIKKLTQSLYISGGITAGLCLIFWIMPGAFFDFSSVTDAQWKDQLPAWFHIALLEDRQSMLSGDALRSLIFILLAAGVLYFSLKQKDREKSTIGFVAILAVLVLVDLWGVDKRYLNDESFHSKITSVNRTFQATKADEAILQDKSPSYRVLDLNNPFANAITSYRHKSIGGYHAAKMKRYQELIDYHLGREIGGVISSFNTQSIDTIMQAFSHANGLNMLNAKYIIFSPEQPPLVNPYALGNAWFVNNFAVVNNADEEIAALAKVNPATMAVVDKRFENELKGLILTPDSLAQIELTTYKPDRLVYKSKASSEQLAVFSEVYYGNGWTAYVDGKPSPHFRADWTLRAMRIPAGEHEIEFKFEPTDYNTARTAATASSGILVLALIGFVVSLFMRKKN